jgi:nucleotide-binding universal stress UspA family protein
MKNLLVPVDFSDVTDRVVATAERLARATSAKIWLIHCVHEYPQFIGAGEVVPMIPIDPDVPLSERFPQQDHQLSTLAFSIRGKGIDAETLLILGSPADEIVSAAHDHDVEMIVMGSHGHGALYELMVGTATQAVLRHTTRPVLVVPSETYKELKTVPAEQWTEPMATPY